MRVRKKLGPKKTQPSVDSDSSHEEHERAWDRDVFSVFSHPGQIQGNITVAKLLPYLQLYQTWFYGYWPVLSVAHLMLRLVDNSQGLKRGRIVLTEKTAMPYALCCSVAAAIATQISFVSAKERVLNIENVLPAKVYADEAIRVRQLFDCTANPRILTLLSLFFLYAHFVNQKGRTAQAIMYLRESISMCQILGFHDPGKYIDKSVAEVHRWKKIYYMLLITERFMCFEDGMPVILDACIEFPSLANEEYPGLLVGFAELAKVFSVPDKNFFGAVNRSLYLHDPLDKKWWILDVQTRLLQPLSAVKISDSQKLNILLSQLWIQAIAWHITLQSGLLQSNAEHTHCFAVDFPMKIASDFLVATKDLPSFAFESNGPGICVKLLEIANALTFALPGSKNTYSIVDNLELVFNLVNKFKNDVTLPVDVFNKVASILCSFKNTVPRPIVQERFAEKAYKEGDKIYEVREKFPKEDKVLEIKEFEEPAFVDGVTEKREVGLSPLLDFPSMTPDFSGLLLPMMLLYASGGDVVLGMGLPNGLALVVGVRQRREE